MYGNYYNPYNTYNPYDYQQQFQQPQQPQQPQQAQQQFKYVGSIEEVRASATDFTGGVSYFVDVANNTIYSKQLAPTGLVDIKTYRLSTEQPTKPSYVEKEEFLKLKTDFDNLINQLTNPKEGVTND